MMISSFPSKQIKNMFSTKIYLIPHWVISALRLNGLNASDLLQFSKIKSTLSASDLAGISALASDEFESKIFKNKNSKIFSNIFYEWSVRATPEDQSYLLDQITAISHTEGVLDLIRDRLFSKTNAQGSVVAKLGISSDSEKSYELIDLQDRAIGIVINDQGFSPEKMHSLRSELIRDIIKQLYVYESSTSVASHPAMTLYLESLMSVD